MRNHCFVFTMVLSIAGTFGSQPLLVAAPTVEDSLPAIDVRDEKKSRSLQAEALREFKNGYKNLLGFKKQVESGKLKTITPQTIGKKLNVPARNCIHAATQLMARGEPAGLDLFNRGRWLHGQMMEIVNARLDAGDMGKRFGPQMLGKEAGRHLKQLNNVRRSMAAGNFEKADATMHEIFNDLTNVSIWFPGGHAKGTYRTYFDTNGKLQPAVRTYWNRQASNDLQTIRDKKMPDFEAALRSVTAAAKSIGTSGSADFDGTQLSGPAWLLRFVNRYEMIHRNTLHCRGLDLARVAIGDENAFRDLQKLRDTEEQFKAETLQTISALIEADARRATSSDAAGLYGEYIRTLALLVAPGDDNSLAEAVRRALDQLASRSPELESDVKAYRAATRELLRWRERVAGAVSDANTANVSSLTETLVRLSSPEKGELRFFSLNQNGVDARLFGPSHYTVADIGRKLVGERVFVGQSIRARDGSNDGTSVSELGIYAHFDISVDATAVLQDLRESLLIDDTNPPLSIDAAAAIAWAENGDFLEVGGEVTGMELEGRISKLATISAADWGLARSFPDPTKEITAGPIQFVMLRCKIQPAWYRHKYFFVSAN